MAKSRIIRRRESLVLYKSFHTLWRKPFHANDFFPDSFLPHFSFVNSAEKITPAGLVSFKTDLKSKRRGYKNIDRCNGASVYFVFCRLYPLLPLSTTGSLWILPVISLLLTNTVSPVRPGLSYDGRGLVGPNKKTTVGLLVLNPLWIGL